MSVLTNVKSYIDRYVKRANDVAVEDRPKNDIDREGCRNGSLERLWCLLGRFFLEFAVIVASRGLFFAALGLYLGRFFNIFARTRKP